jgi:hypothetical protein
LSDNRLTRTMMPKAVNMKIVVRFIFLSFKR